MIESYVREPVASETGPTGKRVEIYLDSCSIRGSLQTTQTRVSDHLNASDEPVCLKDARVVPRDGEPIATDSTVYVNKSTILFVVDLTPRLDGQRAFQVERAEHAVTLNIGTIWIRGHVHLPVDGEMQTFFGGIVARFMPLTQATVVGHEATAPRTVLINRDQLRCLMAE